MQGTTQSYDIHDSAQYRAAKRMQRQLDKDEYTQAAGPAEPNRVVNISKNGKLAAPKIQKSKLAK